MTNTHVAQLGQSLLLLMVAAVLLGGCRIFEETDTVQLELDFASVLPQGWRALRTWQEVSIDGDADVEYLLLFQFDNGQIGAVIYDPQTSSDYIGLSELPETVVTSGTLAVVTTPLQSFGFFRPYRLLPSYWSYTYAGRVGQGVVAMPSDASRVDVFETRNQSIVDNFSATGGDSMEELVLRGGNTHLTFVWWKGLAEGYGVTQLVAPGGFAGVDWAVWEENPAPIERVSGLYPLSDFRGRSLLCREVQFDRILLPLETATGATDPGPQDRQNSAEDSGSASAIVYAETDMGLRFCADAPPHPFYPEGVVMALLASAQTSSDGGLFEESSLHLFTPSLSQEQVLARLDLARVKEERVAEIETHATIPVSPATLQSGEFAPTTSVCVELVSIHANATRRWLIFTLRYQPPNLELRLPDRWSISDVVAAPPPIQGLETDYCRAILDLGQ